jgi:hypothetical protein
MLKKIDDFDDCDKIIDQTLDQRIEITELFDRTLEYNYHLNGKQYELYMIARQWPNKLRN